jgi:hypothetical protein
MFVLERASSEGKMSKYPRDTAYCGSLDQGLADAARDAQLVPWARDSVSRAVP